MSAIVAAVSMATHPLVALVQALHAQQHTNVFARLAIASSPIETRGVIFFVVEIEVAIAVIVVVVVVIVRFMVRCP